MPDKYKAFLSYSQKDTDFATWLHKQLEGWKVPKDLIGRQTPSGNIPKSLQLYVYLNI